MANRTTPSAASRTTPSSASIPCELACPGSGAMVRPHHALDWTTFDNMKSSGKALQVVLADDHHFFREGLRGVLAEDDIAVVGEATNGEEAVTLVGELTPDVLVIDLNMPGSGGLDAIRRIVASSPAVEVVVLSVSADGADVLQALAAG